MKARAVQYSRTFARNLDEVLAYDELVFGEQIAKQKQALVRTAVEQNLAHVPRIKPPHPSLGLTSYLVPGTPFVVLYDFTDDLLRMHFIMHKSANLDDLDPSAVEW